MIELSSAFGREEAMSAPGPMANYAGGVSEISNHSEITDLYQKLVRRQAYSEVFLSRGAVVGSVIAIGKKTVRRSESTIAAATDAISAECAP